MRKEKKWSILVYLLVAFFCLGFASCSSDDNSESAASLTGVWKCTYKYEAEFYKDNSGNWSQIKEKEKTYGDKEGSYGFLFGNNGDLKLLMNVKADGTYELETNEEFKYKIEKGHLYIMEVDHSKDGYEDWGVISINGNTFKLSSEVIEGDEREVEIVEYKKI